jgi:hypothetical protein
VTRELVAQVVGLLFLTSGRQVTHEVIDAWAVALRDTPERGDELAAATELARGVEYVTLAQFCKALTASRRRRALAEQTRRTLAAGPVASVGMTATDWSAFVNGARAAAAKMGKPAPRFPDRKPADVSFVQIIDGMFRPPTPEAAA